MTSLKEHLVSSSGKVIEDVSEYWGLRNLACEIKKDRKRYRKSHYISLYISLDPKNLKNLEHFIDFRCRESVLRFMLTSVKSLPKERSWLFDAALSIFYRSPGDHSTGESNNKPETASTGYTALTSPISKDTDSEEEAAEESTDTKDEK